MKKFVPVALVILMYTPALPAQTTASFTGKWVGTLTRQRPDGTDTQDSAAFDLTQKGKELTGTAGPPAEQLKIEKGVVEAGKATFEMQPGNGSVYKFVLAIVKGRLQGEVTIERDGTVRARAKIDAEKAK